MGIPGGQEAVFEAGRTIHRSKGWLCASLAFDAAMSLIVRSGVEVWPLEYEDVTLARQLHEQFPGLGARDLCHLASCRRRRVRDIKTFDQALHAVAGVDLANPP